MATVVDRPLRLHTVGDCSTDEAARIVAAAAGRYMERGGGPVWTYTHAWRTVARESWGNVSVLASCETSEDVRLANERGYAAAITVPAFSSQKRHLVYGEVDAIPCPAQTKHAKCDSCRLCFNDQDLRRRRASIAFAVHGDQVTMQRADNALTLGMEGFTQS